MNEAAILNRQKIRSAERPANGTSYTAKDFQLEVLDRLEEMQEFAESLEDSWTKKLEAVKEQRLLKFDSRTLIAMGALALRLTLCRMRGIRRGRMRRSRLRKRGSCDWSKLRLRIQREGFGPRCSWISCARGQNEIKAMIQAHDRKSGERK